jgi:hypothetical protein
LVRRVPTLRLAVPPEEVPWAPEKFLIGLRSLPVEW